MKICYLNYIGGPTIQAARDNTIGGLNTIIYNLANSISLLPECEVQVVYRDDGLDVASQRLKIKKILAGKPEVLSRRELEECLPEFLDATAKYLSQTRPDLIHTSGVEAGQVMCQLRESGVFIPWVHTNYATLSVRHAVLNQPSDSLVKIIGEREKKCLLSCDHIVALSESDKTEIVDIFKIPECKISIVHPGIDTKIFWPNRNEERENIIISAGRLSKIKDFPFLLRAFSIFSKFSTENYRLFIVGGNTQERTSLGLLELVEQLGIIEMVDFIDGVNQHELANYFRKSKIFVASSQHETFGLLPVEARACGTPFVARANSGYMATAQDGFGGYFCQNNSESDMAKKILEIAALDQKQWKHLSRQAISSTLQYNWENSAKESFSIYRNLM